MKEINAKLLQKLKTKSEEEKTGYKEIGKAQFEDKTDKWHKAKEHTRDAETEQMQTFAFSQMN